MNVAKLAEFDETPMLVLENISDEDAQVCHRNEFITAFIYGYEALGNSWGYRLTQLKNVFTGQTERYFRANKLYCAPLWQVGVAHSFEDGSTDLSIGAEIKDGEKYPEVDSFEIPTGTWAMFSGKGKVYQGLAALITKIFTEWLPSSGYEQSMQYTVEIYPPGNSQSDDYAFEIWIPVKKK